MQPTQLALVIHKGATFRARLRVMQPTPEYRDITEIIAAAPVRLTVGHGLPTDWPIWIERVRQLTALNRAPIQQQPHFARVVDAATLEISAINAAGTNPAGGQILYYPPLPLTGATAELTLYEKGEAVGTLPVTVDAGGWVDVVLTADQTEALEWSALEYTLDVQLGSTDVLRVYAGKATAIAAGTAPATCQGFVVIGGDRGPAGPAGAPGPAFQVDATGLLIDRSAHNGEEVNFSYLATDNGMLYLRIAGGGWSDGTPFQGPPGDVGPAGPMGPPGPEGPAGVGGAQGAPGPQGLPGPEGPAGPVGPPGTEGLRGEAGPQGPEGPSGPQGPQGETGAGLAILGSLGSIAELPGTGVQGDAYIINGDLWVWATASSDWVNAGNIQGPQGIQGETGESGMQGPAGPQGEVGPVGPVGPDGPEGPQGVQGIQGPAGPEGPVGEDGREVELRNNGTHIQWRYLGDVTWINLAALADLGSGGGGGGFTAVYCKATNSASLSVPNGTFTEVTLNTTVHEAGGEIHNPASNPGRLTVPAGQGGAYIIGAGVFLSASSSGRRVLRIQKNGSSDIVRQDISPVTVPTAPTGLVCSSVVTLAAGDYITCQAFQDSGSTLQVMALDFSPMLWMARVG